MLHHIVIISNPILLKILGMWRWETKGKTRLLAL